MEHKPRHIAIIMDGNGRWAERRHLPRMAGHKAGLAAVRRVVQESIAQNIEVLTLFAFSRENWQRPQQEVHFLMDLLMKTLKSEVKRLHENSVRLTIIGDKAGLNLKLQDALTEVEQLTAENTAMNLVVALNYGGSWDLAQATRQIAKQVARGELHSDAIDEALLSRHLETGHLPDPDLLIRTSGELRLSNFLLMQLAYAELYFTDVLWPDFAEVDLQAAISAYASRQRRYGGVMVQEKAS